MPVTTNFTDPETARRLRDLIDRIVIDAIDERRPNDQFGTVTAIENDNRRVWVLFAGAPDSVPVTVGGMQPSAIGQVVRVSMVRPGLLVVVDVQGDALLTATVTANMPTITGLTVTPSFESLFIDWDDAAAPRYEVNVADDSGFTTNNRVYLTDSSQISVSGLAESTTYYVRVRTVNLSQTSVGAWSGTVNDTTTSAPPSLDGSPPSSSPQPTVTGGIGMVTADWAAATGTTDIITYEVHVSLSSGFTPGAGTLLDETTARFAVVTQLPDGTPLTDHFATNIFVRLIAKDDDGAAAVGAQGFAMPRTVETGDVGTVQIGQIRDGSAPSASPVAVVTNGAGYLLVTWLPVTNNDAVTYEIHMSDSSGFTPGGTSLSVETPSNYAFIREETDVIDVGNPPLDDAVTYYVRIVAKDLDGVAAVGVEDSGSPLDPLTIDNTNTTTYIIDEIVAATITIGDANIVDGKITNLTAAVANIWRANIQDLAVDTAQINDLAVDTAKIALLAVQDAQIDNATITSAKIADLAADKITAGTISVAVQLDAATILGGSLAIGTTPNWFNVDTAGNIWSGGATFGAASFSVSNAGALTADNVTITGGQLDVGTNAFQVNASGQMFLGAATFGAAPFSVNTNGDLIAASIAVTGGSVDLGVSTALHMDNTGRLWTGHADFASAPFSVAANGDLVASSATIDGAITGGTIDIGAASAFHVDSAGNMWIGDAVFGSAEFSVTSGGSVEASNMTITGGDLNINGNFVVSALGALTATSVDLSGELNALAGSTLPATYFQDGATTASITVDTGGWIRSQNFVTGVSGWTIDPDGSAEFDDVTIRGVLEANSVDGWLTADGTTSTGFRTSSSGQRVELSGGTAHALYFPSNDSGGETRIARLELQDLVTGNQQRLNVLGPAHGTGGGSFDAQIFLYGRTSTVQSHLDFTADFVIIDTGFLELDGGTDVSLSSNSGKLMIGPRTGQHVAFDGNEIQSKSNGTTAGNLLLQNEGGQLTLGANSSTTVKIGSNTAAGRGVVQETYGRYEFASDGRATHSYRTDTSGAIHRFYSDNTSTKTLHCNIGTSGNLTNTNNSYGAISDPSIKHSITRADRFDSGLRGSEVIRYRLNSEGDTGPWRYLYNAASLKQQLPHLVETIDISPRNDATDMVDVVNTMGLVPMLHMESNAHADMFDIMRAEIDTLKSQVNALMLTT